MVNLAENNKLVSYFILKSFFKWQAGILSFSDGMLIFETDLSIVFELTLHEISGMKIDTSRNRLIISTTNKRYKLYYHIYSPTYDSLGYGSPGLSKNLQERYSQLTGQELDTSFLGEFGTQEQENFAQWQALYDKWSEDVRKV